MCKRQDGPGSEQQHCERSLSVILTTIDLCCGNQKSECSAEDQSDQQRDVQLDVLPAVAGPELDNGKKSQHSASNQIENRCHRAGLSLDF